MSAIKPPAGRSKYDPFPALLQSLQQLAELTEAKPAPASKYDPLPDLLAAAGRLADALAATRSRAPAPKSRRSWLEGLGAELGRRGRAAMGGTRGGGGEAGLGLAASPMDRMF